MKIHEYQAKELLKKFEIPVLKSRVVSNDFEAGKVIFDEFESQGINTIVIKAQIHAGGRGKGLIYDNNNEPVLLYDKQVRGVNVITGDNISDKGHKYSKAILNNKLVTIQTGDAGSIVRKILIKIFMIRL